MVDTLRVGEELGTGKSLNSGAYSLTLQDDGNLVLEEPGKVIWSSGTNGSGVTRGMLQQDGNFVLYAGEDAKWSTKTDGKSADRLTLQPDRNLVLYGGDSALWSSSTATDTPMAAEQPAAAAAARTYTMADGDTLWAVAEQFYGDGNRFQEIVAASGIADPDMVSAGQVLTIP
ncbi:MAG: lectin [Nocardia sp.]|uniref:LysM peptidoglycan-binding domain-containing protein n=1 Tax=Nocardia sp. TaxID=1821 RepID=UPI0026046203|nr:LysM peptidoglycan-binding domain-containing protein [Nocardia sp.]MCU1647542.1 lectin [Nocardia sp.]